MIIFKKVRWKNFLSTGNIWTEVDLTKAGTSLVVGANGSGKSTLIDAISFCLFNKPFRKINKPQLVNSITNKNCLVEVEFTLGQTEYKIVRGIKPAIFEIYQDDSLVNQDAASRDYQDIVERHILKISHKSFCQVVILGSSTYVPFMQLPSMARREIIEDLLDLQIFTTMNAVLKEKIIENDQTIFNCTNEMELLREKIAIIKEHQQGIEADNQLIIDEKEVQIIKHKHHMQSQQSEKTILQEEFIERAKRIEPLIGLQEALRDVEKLEAKIEHSIDTTNKSLEFFTNNAMCPTCQQDMSEEFKNISIEKKRDRLTKLANGLGLALKKKDTFNEKINEINTYINHNAGVSLNIERLTIQIDHLARTISQIEKEIEDIRIKTTTTTTERIEQYEAELEQLSITYNNLQQQRKIFDVLQYVLKDGGIKSKIIRQYIPVINKFINKYLSSMDFFVDFSLDEEFNETIKSRFRDAFSYESFSEGEKFRINLAILFAWRAIAKLRNSINTNLLIMDEVMDSSLDANGTEEFLKILLQLSADTNTFIISHKTDILYDKFDRVLTFDKRKNFSSVLEK